MLPPPVLEQVQAELRDWRGIGVSVLEQSHRSEPFREMAARAETDLRALLAIPDAYRVLFLHGGARAHFSSVPLNLSQPGDVADHILTGQWSRAALEEHRKYLTLRIAGECVEVGGTIRVPMASELSLSENAAFVHYCPNETIDGIEFLEIPESGERPLVADMSSTLLSRPIDVSRFGLIYAGAQKNIGPAGLAVVIVHEELLGHARPETPLILDYTLAVREASMGNTPPTFAWYVAGLVLRWIREEGGLQEMERRARERSRLLYDAVDASGFYRNRIDRGSRSWMNVPFQLERAELDETFLAEAEAEGLRALRGHRFVGGMRASLYNAMPKAGVEALVAFMAEFERRRG
jgi:phosphoserine aminotransferase